MKRVAIAKLKAYMASYMAKVKAGESFLITDRETPVGTLSPVYLDPSDKDLARLVCQGLVRPPEGTLAEQKQRWEEFFKEPPAFKDPEGFLRKALLQEREEGR